MSTRKISALIHTDHDARQLARALETLRCCDEVLVVDHNSHEDTKKVAHEYGAKFREAVAGVDDGAYAFDCQYDWIFCLLPSETVSEALEAAVLEWKQAEPEEVTGYTVSIREQFHEAWRQSGHEMRLVNRKRVNWTGRIPPMTTNSRQLSGDLLRFSE